MSYRLPPPISRNAPPLSRAGAVADPAAREAIMELKRQLDQLQQAVGQARTSAPPLVLELISGLQGTGAGTLRILARKLVLSEHDRPQLTAEYPAGLLDVSVSPETQIIQNITQNGGGGSGTSTPLVVICGGWSTD